ncbi:hypothetical protein GBA52_023116 [Prunus armeniaca]|nr:hypothetical protein GBA52_023116 [Prunus armeniaca]
MEERHHTKWLVKKKKLVEKSYNNKADQQNLGEYYSNYSPEDSKEGDIGEKKEEEEVEEEDVEEDDVEENPPVMEQAQKPSSISRQTKSCLNNREILWEGEPVGQTCSGEALYKRAILWGEEISVGGAVLVELDESNELPAIYFVEYMYETLNGSKMFHGRVMERGSQTVLGNTANEREAAVVDIKLMPWGHQYRKDNADANRTDRTRAEERKRKGLPTEYYCKSLYCPERVLSLVFHVILWVWVLVPATLAK